jgi:hypothetical protein
MLKLSRVIVASIGDQKFKMAAMTRLTLILEKMKMGIPIGSNVKLSRVMVAILNFKSAPKTQI